MTRQVNKRTGILCLNGRRFRGRSLVCTIDASHINMCTCTLVRSHVSLEKYNTKYGEIECPFSLRRDIF